MKKKLVAIKRKKRGSAATKKLIDAYMSGRMHSTQLLECACGNSVETGPDCDKVTCSDCVQKHVAAPSAQKQKQPKVSGRKRGRPRKNPVKVKSGFPRGWHFRKKYVHTDGSVWERGKRVETKAVKQARKKIAAITEL